MTPCPDCRIENRGPRNPMEYMEYAGTTVMDLHIIFCPLHAQAGALREALKNLQAFVLGITALLPLADYEQAKRYCEATTTVIRATQEPRR